MPSQNGDSVASCQIGNRAEVAEAFPLRKGFENARLAGRVFKDKKAAAAQRLSCVAEDRAKTAHAVEAAVEREGRVETRNFAREHDALDATDVGGVGEEEVEALA